jgi:hypothetical protein
MAVPAPAQTAKPKDDRARIPETVILNLHKVSPAAGQLYLYYCARRNHQSLGWHCKPIKEIAALLGMSANRGWEARRELLSKGWIAERDCGTKRPFVVPLCGFDDAHEASCQQHENSDAQHENSCQQHENSCSAIDKDRARGSTDPLPTHSTVAAAAPAAQQHNATQERHAADELAVPPAEFTLTGYLQYLTRQPAYNHVDPIVEESKIKIWHERPKNKHRRITAQFLQGWVNRIERPLEVSDGIDGRTQTVGGRNQAQAGGGRARESRAQHIERVYAEQDDERIFSTL